MTDQRLPGWQTFPQFLWITLCIDGRKHCNITQKSRLRTTWSLFNQSFFHFNIRRLRYFLWVFNVVVIFFSRKRALTKNCVQNWGSHTLPRVTPWYSRAYNRPLSFPPIPFAIATLPLKHTPSGQERQGSPVSRRPASRSVPGPGSRREHRAYLRRYSPLPDSSHDESHGIHR